ncbi:MAG: CoA-binding protein, partial [Chromatiales bacterium]
MSIRNLDYLFRPKSIALIGASKTAQSIGALLAQNLIKGGFRGSVMPVNPKYRDIAGVTAYADIASLPSAPDLAVIATPPVAVPEIIRELGQRGTKAAVVISAGFGEVGGGKPLQQALIEAVRPYGMRIIGPNCLGILVPALGLNASFAHLSPIPGKLAFVAQSGAIVTSVLDWAQDRGIGFSHLISLGD